ALLQCPGVPVRVGEVGQARVRAALRIGSGGELTGPLGDRRLVPDVTDLDAAGNQFPVGGREILDDQVVGPRRPRGRVGQPVAELDRAGRPGRGQLDYAETVARVIVHVEVEA